MLNFGGRAALLGAAISLCGCGDLLDTGFNLDNAGQAPSMTSVGINNGAQIRPGSSRNMFVTSKAGLMGEQALAFIETKEAINGSNRTFLQSKPITDLSAPVHVSWHGQFGNGGELKVVLGYLGQPYVSIRFDNGDIFVGDTWAGSFLPGDLHDVLVTLEPNVRTYNVSFTGDGQYRQSVLTGSAPKPKNDAGNQVIADFGIESSGQERLVYVLDDVRMSHRTPR